MAFPLLLLFDWGKGSWNWASFLGLTTAIIKGYDFTTSYLYRTNLDPSRIYKGYWIFALAISSNIFNYDALYQCKPKKTIWDWSPPHSLIFLANAVDNKGLISSLYKMLLDKSLANIQMPGRIGWGHRWWDTAGDTKSGSNGLPLTHANVNYRSYRMPIQLHR